MSMTIYLAGYINDSVLDQCIAWRKKIRDTYDNWKGGERYPLEILDPLNTGHLDQISNGGLNGNLPHQMVVHMDYECVKRSDLVIANMSTFGETRPLIGTTCEIAWAYEFRKPIILITDDPVYKNHPFMKCFASIMVDNVDELLSKKIINIFFKAWNSAQY